MELEVGSIVEGKVTGITKFGAFVSLPGGQTGMVHISEVAHAFVNDINDHLSEGQDVKVKVLAVERDGRTNLSIKKATAPPPLPPRPRPVSYAGGRRNGPVRGESATFEDKLKQFMQDSQSKMSDMKTADRRASRKGRGR